MLDPVWESKTDSVIEKARFCLKEMKQYKKKERTYANKHHP